MEKAKKKTKRSNKMPNGFGGVRKLPGDNRRNPYQAVVTVGWEVVNGKQRQIQKAIGYAESREDAITLLSDYRKNPYDVAKDPTFAEVYELLDIDRRGGSQKHALKTAYKRSARLHNMKIRSIRKPDMQPIADELTPFSVSTQQAVKALWELIFNFGMEHDIILKDYSQFVTWKSTAKPKRKYPFTAEQVNNFSDDFKILCYTGMRIAEYLAVKSSDVYDNVIHNVGTKTEYTLRDIPIHKEIKELIEKKLGNEYLCPGVNGQMLYNYFRVMMFEPEMARLGIKGHTIHDTRRTFITYCKRSGIDEMKIKKLAGHKAGDVTEDVYTYRDMAEMKDAMNTLIITDK